MSELQKSVYDTIQHNIILENHETAMHCIAEARECGLPWDGCRWFVMDAFLSSGEVMLRG